MAAPGGEITAAILRVAPALGPWGVPLVVAALLIGAGALLYAKIQDIESARGAQRAVAYGEAHKVVQEVAASPAGVSTLAEAGTTPDVVVRAFDSSAYLAIAAEIPVLEYPTFETLSDLDTWYFEWQTYYTLGTTVFGKTFVDETTYYSIYSHYTSEYYRLAGAEAPTVAAPILTTEVPGVGTVGVRVTLRTTEGVPITYPTAAPPAPIVITTPPSPVSVINNIDVSALSAAIAAALGGMGLTLDNSIGRASEGATGAISGAGDTVSKAIGGLAGGLAGSLPLAMTGAISAIISRAPDLGHALQQGRNRCFGSTGFSLLQQLLPTALGAFAMKTLSSEEGLGGWVSDQARKWFEGALDPSRFPAPATPETVFTTATARLKEAMSFGLQAHMFSIMAESNFIAKNLGMPQVAGFLADMAGFKRIADATLGQVEQAALGIPMRQLALRTYRPSLPGLGDLEEMYAKKEIPFSTDKGNVGLSQVLALSGFTEDWIKVYSEYLWKDPRLGEVIRIGQFFSPALVPALARPGDRVREWMNRVPELRPYIDTPDWYYAWRAAKGGYDPADIAILVETAKRATARREQTLYLDAVTRLARDGYITIDEARADTVKAWAFSDPIGARMDAIALQGRYKILSDTRSVVVMSMSRGLITRDEAREQLSKLGLDGTRVELEVLKATLGMIPGMRLTVSRPEEVLDEFETEGA